MTNPNEEKTWLSVIEEFKRIQKPDAKRKEVKKVAAEVIAALKEVTKEYKKSKKKEKKVDTQ